MLTYFLDSITESRTVKEQNRTSPSEPPANRTQATMVLSNPFYSWTKLVSTVLVVTVNEDEKT